jgi:hypothetical protein
LEAGSSSCDSDNYIDEAQPAKSVSDQVAWDARRRIERLRELRRLRELLDDPYFDELD